MKENHKPLSCGNKNSRPVRTGLRLVWDRDAHCASDTEPAEQTRSREAFCLANEYWHTTKQESARLAAIGALNEYMRALFPSPADHVTLLIEPTSAWGFN